MPGIDAFSHALMYAQAGVGRAGATRAGYHSAQTFVLINGVQQRARVDYDTLEIQQVLDETPDTASFRTIGITPTKGQSVVIKLGSINNPESIFAGHALKPVATMFERPTQGFITVNAIDYTWLMNRTKVLKRYLTRSATDIIIDLIQTYAPDFSIASVMQGLPVIDEITLTNEDLTDSLTRVMERIGGYWYPDYNKVIHAFTGSEVGVTHPRDLVTPLSTLHDWQIEDDLSPMITRVTYEGGGGITRAPVAVGASMIPVDSVTFYSGLGGTVQIGVQRITYSSISSTTIPSAPVASQAAGAGVETGVHQYAFTWVTAAGETTPSPLGSANIGHQIVDPASAPTLQNRTFAGSFGAYWNIGDSLYLVVTYLNAAGETLASAQSNTIIAQQAFGGFPRDIDAPSLPVSTDPEVTTKRIYLNINGVWRDSATILNIATNSYSLLQNGVLTGAALTPPGANTTAGNQGAVSSIAVGPVGVTSRKVYRTVAAGSQLKLVATIANNTATTYTDSTPDASLGANAPTSDTSGLTLLAITSTNGATSVGATSITVLSTAGFPVSGVLLLGELMLTYTGVTPTTFTGIPATGIGAVLAAIPTATEVQAASVLQGIPATGTGSIATAIPQGEDVNIIVTVNNLTAQAALKAALNDPLGLETGVREEYVQDRRLSITEATARAQALLDARSTSLVTVRYKTRDLQAKVGRTVTIPNVIGIFPTGTFKIQDVTINEFSAQGIYYPMRTVTASSRRYSLEDLLRQIRTVH